MERTVLVRRCVRGTLQVSMSSPGARQQSSIGATEIVATLQVSLTPRQVNARNESPTGPLSVDSSASTEQQVRSSGTGSGSALAVQQDTSSSSAVVATVPQQPSSPAGVSVAHRGSVLAASRGLKQQHAVRHISGVKQPHAWSRQGK